jgi:hypothetical protein
MHVSIFMRRPIAESGMAHGRIVLRRTTGDNPLSMPKMLGLTEHPGAKNVAASRPKGGEGPTRCGKRRA